MRKRRSQRARRAAAPAQAGFTLLELVIVIVVAGVLGALAYPRFTSSTYASASFAEQIATGLRYAQRFAVASGCEVQVVIDAGSDTLSLLRRNGGGDQACGSGAFDVLLPLPGQSGNYQVSAPAGADVSSGLSVVFDAQGTPDAGGSVLVDARTVQVESGSGYVH